MSNESKIIIAKKDIICYKLVILKQVNPKNSTKKIYKINREFQDLLPVKGGRQKAKRFPKEDRYRYIENGFYAYLHEKDVKKRIKEKGPLIENSKAIVLKCLVPKGTRIIKGRQGWGQALRAEYMIHGIM